MIMKKCDNGYWDDYFCEWMCILTYKPCEESKKHKDCLEHGKWDECDR